ncbi:MAG: hypothetical protein ACLKAK_02270 [Alkaliphilus sp.]
MKCNNTIIKIEKIIFSAVLLLFFLLILSNVKTIYVQQITVDITHSNIDYTEKGTLSIRIQGEKLYPDLEIILNGEVYKCFENNASIAIEVKNYDVIQINGSMYEEEIIIESFDISNNIKVNKLHMSIKINSNTKTLAIIRI